MPQSSISTTTNNTNVISSTSDPRPPPYAPGYTHKHQADHLVENEIIEELSKLESAYEGDEVLKDDKKEAKNKNSDEQNIDSNKDEVSNKEMKDGDGGNKKEDGMFVLEGGQLKMRLS